MESLHIGRAQYLDAVQETKGQKGSELIRELHEREERLRTTAAQFNGKIKEVAPDKLKSPAEQQEHVEETVQEITRVTRGNTTLKLHNPMDAEENAKTLADTADHLKQAQADLKPLEHSKTEEHEGNIAGTAHLNQKGSQTHDGRKIQGDTTIISASNAEGLGAHEDEHTQQEVQDAAAVRLHVPDEELPSTQEDDVINDIPAEQDPIVEEDAGTEPEAKENTMTSLKLQETGAMIAQVEENPESFQFLSDDYKKMFRETLSLMPDKNRVRELARRKDGLRLFAREVAQKKAS